MEDETLKPHSCLGKNHSLILFPLNKQRKTLTYQRIQHFKFQIAWASFISSPAYQNGFMIYEWHRDSRIFK